MNKFNRAEFLKQISEGKTAKEINMNLYGVDLVDANLRGANLSDANLSDADLRGANLGYADLRGANLNGANLRGADLRYADLRYANLNGANLRGVDLVDANLRGANLSDANLSGADLDFSCLPLWCGGLNWKVDEKFMRQLTYHLCSMDCEDEEWQKLRPLLLDFANKFRRAGMDCDKLELRKEVTK